MSFKDGIINLQRQIAEFMGIHRNPFDTHVFDRVAEDIQNLNQLLSKVAGGGDASSTSSIGDSVGARGANRFEDVRTVQQLLNQHGQNLLVDGDAGPKTINAIRSFQQAKGLTVDGLITPNGETFAALKSASSGGSNSAISGSVGAGGQNQPDDVKTVQTLLNGKGASLQVDGDAGPRTINAIKNFQRSLGHRNPDGRVDVDGATWRALTGSGGTATGGGGNPGGGQTGGGELPPALSATSRISASVGQGGQNKPQDVTTVSTILQRFYSNVQVTSTSNSALVEAIQRFQREYRNMRRPDGRVDANGGTWNTLLGIGRIKGELASFAQRYGVEPAFILAIQSIESGGNGFLSDGRPRILFEGHIFWRELERVGINPRAHLAGNGDIIYRRWVNTHYVGGTGEYGRLERAKRIHEDAALRSASWGEFQVMGFNHRSVGYPNVKEFVESMQSPGSNQLSAVMEYCRSNNLLRYVSGPRKNWAAFAEGYNGSGYAANQYDTKLANAYARFSRIV